MNAAARPLTALVLACVAGGAPAADFGCLLEPFVVVNASTAMEGILESVTVRRGDEVKRGDVVATLHSKVERASLDYATARARASAARTSREVRLEQRRAKFRRAEELSRSRFVSPDEIDELASELRIAEQALHEEAENAELARLEVERVGAMLAARSVRSPIDGVIVDRFLSPGEFAQAKPIVRVAQLDPLHVEAVLPVSRYGTVRAGMTAKVRPEAPVGGEYDAVVKVVDQVIDATSGTFRVRLELPNPGYRLPAGLECRVSFAPAD